jgi:hypothetical protein
MTISLVRVPFMGMTTKPWYGYSLMFCLEFQKTIRVGAMCLLRMTTVR